MVSKQVKVKVSYNIIETSNFDQKTCSRSCVASLASGTLNSIRQVLKPKKPLSIVFPLSLLFCIIRKISKVDPRLFFIAYRTLNLLLVGSINAYRYTF